MGGYRWVASCGADDTSELDRSSELLRVCFTSGFGILCTHEYTERAERGRARTNNFVDYAHIYIHSAEQVFYLPIGCGRGSSRWPVLFVSDAARKFALARFLGRFPCPYSAVGPKLWVVDLRASNISVVLCTMDLRPTLREKKRKKPPILKREEGKGRENNWFLARFDKNGRTRRSTYCRPSNLSMQVCSTALPRMALLPLLRMFRIR